MFLIFDMDMPPDSHLLFMCFIRNILPNMTEQSLISTGENRVQVLKNIPLNSALPQMAVDKRGHLAAPDTTVTVSIASMPTHSIKTETQPHSFTVGIPSAVYHPEAPERVVLLDRNLNADQFSSGAQPQNSQRRTPDSTFSESFKEGVQEVQNQLISFLTVPCRPQYMLMVLFK